MNISLCSYISLCLIRSVVGRSFEVAWKNQEYQITDENHHGVCNIDKIIRRQCNFLECR